MLIVLAKAKVGEGAIDAARDAIAAMEKASREEEGCIAYTFTQSISDPSEMLIVEKWVDDAALAAHFATPHMATFQGALAELDVTVEEALKYEAGEGQALM
jgi:quinol monooxygenase YgiN